MSYAFERMVEAAWKSHTPYECDDECVVLIGFEGQIDRVMPLDDPRPPVLIIPLPTPLTARFDPSPMPEPVALTYRKAEYQRMSDGIYIRRK